jgi:nucleoside-diphosphate-sugar epimerase
MRILVTGSSGLVGSGVAALLRRGHDVIGVDLRPGSQTDVLADISDPERMKCALAGADSVVHIAALHAPHVGRESDADFQRTNVDATASLIDLARHSGIRRFVFTSSTSVYGHALEPAEDLAAWIDEAVKPIPRDVYDRTKIEAERLVRGASGPGFSTAILRMSRCFPEPLPEMTVYRLHRGIDRRDVARAHALALEGAGAEGETFVISARPPFRAEDREELVRDAAAVIRRRAPAVAAEFERRHWPLPRSIGRVYSPARAEARLEFTASYGAEAVLVGDCDPAPLSL